MNTLLIKLSNKKFMYFVSGITQVHNESYEKIIDMYDNDDTLFYCDPPYLKWKITMYKIFKDTNIKNWRKN